MATLENRDLWVQIAELIATIAQGGGGGGSGVSDVKVAGDSVVTDGVANIPTGSTSTFGVYKTEPSFGITVNESGKLFINISTSNEIKAGTQAYKPIVPAKQHESSFYGLAKAAGDSTQSASANAVGTYTDDAKQSIKEMLGITCVIPVAYDDVENAYTSDFTYADIVALIGKGCYCIAVLNGEYIPLSSVDTAHNELTFCSISVGSTEVTSHALIFNTSGITEDITSYPQGGQL